MHEPKRPVSGNWEYNGEPFTRGLHRWTHSILSGLWVCSSVDPNTEGRGLEFHVTVSEFGLYPRKEFVDIVRRDFALGPEWERDDHSKKLASFWLPVEKDKRGACDCAEAG